MERTKTCRECGGRMAEGHIIDEAHGSYRLQRWWRGPPVKNWLNGYAMKRKEGRAITSFRCERCGLLQNYVLNA